jgi:hypothetical protein
MNPQEKTRQDNPWWTVKGEVVKWSSMYDRKADPWDQKTEFEVGSRLRRRGSLSKTDLKTMVRWKFHRLPGRRAIVLGRLSDVPNSNIETTFLRAIAAPDEGLRLKDLDDLPGIGPAMVSVILTFYEPEEYGVLDIHVWRELFGPEPSSLFQGSRCLMMFLQELRTIAARHAMKARTVEKAIFQRNYDESRRVN